MKTTLHFDVPIDVTVEIGESVAGTLPTPPAETEDPNAAIIRAAYLAAPPSGLGRAVGEPGNPSPNMDPTELASELEDARRNGIEHTLAEIRKRAGD